MALPVPPERAVSMELLAAGPTAPPAVEGAGAWGDRFFQFLGLPWSLYASVAGGALSSEGVYAETGHMPPEEVLWLVRVAPVPEGGDTTSWAAPASLWPLLTAGALLGGAACAPASPSWSWPASAPSAGPSIGCAKAPVSEPSPTSCMSLSPSKISTKSSNEGRFEASLCQHGTMASVKTSCGHSAGLDSVAFRSGSRMYAMTSSFVAMCL